MELTGRLTENAAVKRTKSGDKDFVAFTLVDNHRYKTKSGERKNDATFFSCTYWQSTAVAAHLKKGMIVTLTGRVGINTFRKSNGDYMANLTFRTDNIKFIAKAAGAEVAAQSTEATQAAKPETIDDLPF
jgi:single-strand DNA-binding protein